MKQRSYTAETKAAVLASLLQGQSVSSVAEEYNIPRGTVAVWKSKESSTANISIEKKQQIGEFLLAYLEANLKALRVQVEQFSDKEWLREQNASDAAVLHGVMTDKAIRLLEAFSNDRRNPPKD